MKDETNNEEKKRLSYERQNAVRKAWKEEQARVSDGQGTRKWSKDEQQQLIERGSVRGCHFWKMMGSSL